MKEGEPLTTALEFEVGENVPFTSTRMRLRVLADMLSKDHQVTIHCPWTTKPIVVALNFTPPLTAIWRLHTVLHRKFIHISVTGQCEKDLIVDQAVLKVGGGCTVVGKNCESSQVSSNIYRVCFPKNAASCNFGIFHPIKKMNEKILKTECNLNFFIHVNN